jgi:hypothetical protein
MDFFSNPLFKLDGSRSEIVVPFPEVLLTTAQYRIDNWIAPIEQVTRKRN